MQSDRFRAAAETKDFSTFEEIFAPDVTFRSPAVFRPYEGRDAVAMLLTTVADVFEEFRYTDQVETCVVGDARLECACRHGERTPFDGRRPMGSSAGAHLAFASTRPPRLAPLRRRCGKARDVTA